MSSFANKEICPRKYAKLCRIIIAVFRRIYGRNFLTLRGSFASAIRRENIKFENLFFKLHDVMKTSF